MNLAIIPARSGSKRVKNKNIINFFGKPIIYYSILAALQSKLFDKIIVSTDSKKITKISNQYGAETPFLRPNYLSGDNVPTSSVIKHAINYFDKQNIFFDNICCIYPASPLIMVSNIKKCFNLLKNKNTNYSFPVTLYEYPIQRAFQIKKGYISKMLLNKFYKSNSNNLPHYFHDCGQFYWGKRNAWLKEKKVFTNYSSVIQIPNYLGVDFDTMEDLNHLKIIFSYLFNE